MTIAQEISSPSRQFVHLLQEQGFSFGTGVPCSILDGMIKAAILDPQVTYVSAANEAHGLASLAGATLAGRSSFLFTQNSGFFNILDALTSLTLEFKLPLLMIISWRGEEGSNDVSHHTVSGRCLPSILEMLEIPSQRLPTDIQGAAACITAAAQYMADHGRPFAILVGQDSFGAGSAPCLALSTGEQQQVTYPSRSEILAALIRGRCEDDYFFSTNGHTSRELFMAGDSDKNLYVVGSMGLVSSVALGFSLCHEATAIVVDGDGSFLMHMGAAATNGAYAGQNLIHLVLDNACHDTTGGQPTVSENISLDRLAADCGYRFSVRTETVLEFEAALSAARVARGPAFIHVRIAPGTRKGLVRPSLTPAENAVRIRQALVEPS